MRAGLLDAFRTHRRIGSDGSARAGLVQSVLFLPTWIVFEREEMLDGLGAAGTGLQEGLDGLAQLGEAAIRRVARASGGPIEAIQGGGDIQDSAPRLQEIAAEHIGRVTCLAHDEITSRESLTARVFSAAG
jgi:hypothetical protein